MNRLIILLAVLIFTISCNKEQESIPRTEVTGTWKYVGFSGGIAGLPFTAANNTDLYLQFDTTNAHFMQYRNGDKVCGTYSFERDPSDIYYKGSLSLNSSVEPDKYNVATSNDTLILYPSGYADAFTNYYVASPKHFEWCQNDTH